MKSAILCCMDEGLIQQRWRKGVVNHGLFSAVQGSFTCTWTSVSLNQECSFQCLNGQSINFSTKQILIFLLCKFDFFTSEKHLAYSCLLIQEPCYPFRKIIGEVGGKHEHDFISFKKTGSEALCMSPLAASQRRKLVELYPNIQCSVRMDTVYIYYFYSLYWAYESVKHAGICVDGTFCIEIWGICSLFCFSTSEVLSCSGMLSMTPQQMHCWPWCWTWHPSGIGPLFGKSTSYLTCMTWTWF